MVATLSTNDIFELLMLEEVEWAISNEPIDRLNYIPPAQSPPFLPSIENKTKSPPKTTDLTDNFILQAQQCAEQAKNIVELNAIIEAHDEFNIIANSKVTNFFSSNHQNLDKIDLLIIYSQKSELKQIDSFLKQAQLLKYSTISCSLTPVKSFLAPLDKQQQKIYLPFVKKLIKLTSTKTIITTDAIAALLLNDIPFPSKRKQFIYNDTIIFPIYSIARAKDIWFTILAVKNYLNKA